MQLFNVNRLSACRLTTAQPELPRREAALRVPAQQAGPHQEAHCWLWPAEGAVLALSGGTPAANQRSSQPKDHNQWQPGDQTAWRFFVFVCFFSFFCFLTLYSPYRSFLIFLPVPYSPLTSLHFMNIYIPPPDFLFCLIVPSDHCLHSLREESHSSC